MHAFMFNAENAGMIAQKLALVNGVTMHCSDLQALQGQDPTKVRPEREGESWPSGGAAAFPSFSLFPVRGKGGNKNTVDDE